MINVSSSVKTDCNSDNLKYKEYIVVGGQTVEIRGKMSNSCYNDGNIFGTFIMKKLEFTTENNIDYKGKEVIYYKSINGESFKIGTYIVTEIKDNDSDETVTVTSLDYGLKTAIPYTTELDYTSETVTLFDVLIEACTNAGLNLANGSITNGDFIVDSNQFTDNQLIGDVIKAIAHISGDFVTVNENDEVELVYEEETEEIIEDYTELADKRDTLPITSVSIGTSQVSGQEAILRDEDMIAEYGEHWLVLNDNPFAYTLEKRQELVTAILNKVKGFSYSSFESSFSFKPYLQLGDKIQFRNKAGELINSRVLRIDTDYDDIKLSAPSIINATVDYKQPEDALTIAKRTEIIVNKQTDEIELISKDITDLTEFIITKTGTGKIHLENSVESTGAINKLEITGFTQMALYPGMQYPSDNTYPGVLTQYTIISSPTEIIEEDFEEYTFIAQSPLLSGDTLKIDNGKVTIVRAGGSVETYDNMYIKTFSGDTYITVEYFDDITLTCEYLKENPYTTQFATMQEVAGEIKIAKDEIDLTVSEKVGENEIISKINLSPEEIKILSSKLNISATDILNLIAGNELNLTSKNITIASDKFNVDAYGNLECESATVNSATINGSAIVNGNKFSVDSDGNMTCNGATLTGGTITSQKFKVDAEGNIEASGGILGGYTINSNSLSSDIYSPYTFTQTDFNKLGDYMRGTGTLTNAEKELYDLNKDGILDSMDLLLMRRYIIVGITPQNPGKIKIDNSDVFNIITIEDGNGNKKIDINAFMTVIDHASINNLTVSKLSARNIMYGSIDMTPSQANVPVIASVVFSPAYDSPPCVFACANTLVPGTKVKEVSVANVMTDSFDIVLTRSNTNTTTVYYFAIVD